MLCPSEYLEFAIIRVDDSQCLSIIPPDFSAPSPSDPLIGTRVQITTKDIMLYLSLQ